MPKRLGGIICCKNKTSSSWHSIGFPDGSNIGSTTTVYEALCPVYIIYYCDLAYRCQSLSRLDRVIMPRFYRKTRALWEHLQESLLY